jgi:serine/threonine protein kinase/Tol biopolymer transport system component
MTLTVGTLLNNRYRIISILGQGGMGSVYRAFDENLRLDVAVKENLFLTDEYARQFQLEASILAGLRQPNLPRVGDHFIMPGQGQYLVMDYMAGEDLRQRIERLNCLAEQEVILIGAVICDALTYLHTRPQAVIHRDIKPGNIKITPEGEIYLVDFGLAKVMQDSQGTTTGARAMTPGYSPPEQYGIAHTDSRSDVYSLGATLYAAMTGIIPEDGLARATGKAQLTPPNQLQPKISRRLSSVIDKALAVEPCDRYQTAEEFKQALLQAGDISRLPQGKILISPPPVGQGPDLASTDSPLPEFWPANHNHAQLIPNHSEPVSSRPEKNFWWWIAVMILIVIAVGALLVLGTDKRWKTTAILPRFVSNLLLQSATPTYRATATQKPTNRLALIKTDKPSPPPTNTITPTVTFSLPPSLTPQPTLPFTPPQTPTPSDSPTPNATALGGGMGEIAYSSKQDGTIQIWLMDASGNQLSKITNMSAGACQPTWSPDGNQLAFTSPCDGRHDLYPGAQIYLINADGTNLHLLPVPNDPQGDFDPAWSPDGKKIAFTSLRGGSPHIFLYDLVTNVLIQVTNSHYIDRQPFWEPGGTHLAFVRMFLYAQVWWVDVTNPANLKETQFSPYNNISDYWPAWSSNGQLVLYSQVQPGSNPFLVGLIVSNRIYGTERRIRPDGPDMSYPIAQVNISTDGNYLAFESWPDGLNHDIYTMDIQGANLRRLTQDPGPDFNPAWRPGSITP